MPDSCFLLELSQVNDIVTGAGYEHPVYKKNNAPVMSLILWNIRVLSPIATEYPVLCLSTEIILETNLS